MENRLKRRLLTACLFLACLMPFILLLAKGATGNLGPNPVSDITQDTGVWTLRFLLITLCVTPLRKLTSWSEVIKFRRMLGLFAFFYGFFHLMTYLLRDQFFSIPEMIQDVVNRPLFTEGYGRFRSDDYVGNHLH